MFAACGRPASVDSGTIATANPAHSLWLHSPLIKPNGTAMRLATYNVENLFLRAKALNLDDPAAARPILDTFAALNNLFEEPLYTDANGRAGWVGWLEMKPPFHAASDHPCLWADLDV